MVNLPFTIIATDANGSAANNDKLFARIYVDDVIYDDAEMTRIGATANWTVTFNYKPQPGDGSVDLDGVGPLLVGQHKVRVEVTDGNMIDSRQWTVDVRNTIPFPSLVLNIVSERKALDPASITFTEWTWGSETAGSTTLAGKKYESLYVAGSFKRAGVAKFFLWALDLVDGVVTKTAAGGKWSFNENLNWGSQTRRVSVKTDPVTQVNDIFLTNLSNKYGPFTKCHQLSQDER
ncbi:MAG: hypothetical protein HC902_11100 [Calothrix sp. SM1_5_4]|nr:hypothetical protein [Calothrix sp. SM1_5_4]